MASSVTVADVFWRCVCGHPVYEHGRRNLPDGGGREYVGCRVDGCGCERFEPSDGSKWPDEPAKAAA